MKFFGRRHPYPAYDQGDPVATPLGATCGHCDEPIEPGDDGWILPYIGDPGDPPWLAYHRACNLRNVIGSVAHQQHRCMCFVPGSMEEDDPKLTRRQAAEAAMAYFYRMH